ncbi:hypothetical protein [Actinoplanes sp. L3-i22]|uniref:hypothetical protein n=1 Tax=Actinoplanes sp. L3-i22 TaxID=2836373 RepID=UPI001C77E9C2|nr:hypothetical protein [Actinoplanes sp. L3-i22]BCY08108.1 hypothetical protein L3i22_031960 [Actinoplanes sp. L3-i22]
MDDLELFTEEVAALNGDQPVFPAREVVDRPGDPERWFPGWPGPVLLLSVENQGVCAWGVPLDDPAPPVLVGGPAGATRVFSPDVASFVEFRRWAASCEWEFAAQADELDEVTLSHLRRRYRERPGPRGWPGRATFRFEGADVRIMLWDAPGQCDWFVAGAGEAELLNLLPFADLRTSLYAYDASGAAVLARVRGRG